MKRINYDNGYYEGEVREYTNIREGHGTYYFKNGNKYNAGPIPGGSGEVPENAESTDNKVQEITEKASEDEYPSAPAVIKYVEEEREKSAESLVVSATAGEEASVTKEVTKEGVRLNFTIPEGKPGKDGEQGPPGEKGGQGEPGKDGVSATHSWNGTVLTISSASGTSSADLKGDTGDKGERGEGGVRGEKGDTG